VCELRPRELRVGEDDTLQAASVVGQRPRTEPGQSRFVGREREVDLLREAFETAAAGEGQVVLIVGEAGIGKSRLLAEFRRRLAGTPHIWTEGRCASYATTAAFHPVVDGFQRFLEIDDRDDAASAGAKIERGLLAFGDDLAWTLPFVRHMLALD